MSKSMFHLLPNHGEEPNPTHEFTALSLSTGRNRSSEFVGTLMKTKRQRGLDGSALTIGTGTGSNSSSNISMNEVTNNASSMQQIYENSRAQGGYYGGEIDICKQFQNGEKIGRRRGRGTGGGDSDPEVISTDCNRAMPFQEQGVSEIGSSGGVGNGKKGYGRGGGSSLRIEKLRHRMIKNRESAARSRARKQALEAQQLVENTELKKENDVLKRIVRVLMMILRSKTLKLPTLTRSFSATF